MAASYTCASTPASLPGARARGATFVIFLRPGRDIPTPTDTVLAESCARGVEVLIVGGPVAGANLASELRARGIPARISSTDAEYFASLQEARPAPVLAVVDLSVGPLVRDDEVRARARIAALSGLPSLLIGARPEEVALFANVVRLLPLGVHADDLARAIDVCAR